MRRRTCLMWLMTLGICIGRADLFAQSTQKGLSPEELDQLLAPIALYPDALLSQVLMAATYPLEVVEAARWSKANPNLKGIFGANEGSAEGAAIGVKESGKKLVLIGYDSGKEQKEDITSGLMAGAITQNPIGIGKCVVDSAVKALKGEKLPKKVDTGFYWYDKSNMNDPKISAVLYD